MYYKANLSKRCRYVIEISRQSLLLGFSRVLKHQKYSPIRKLLETQGIQKRQILILGLYVVHSGQKCFIRVACLWSKMPMLQRARMREGGEPLPLAF